MDSRWKEYKHKRLVAHGTILATEDGRLYYVDDSDWGKGDDWDFADTCYYGFWIKKKNPWENSISDMVKRLRIEAEELGYNHPDYEQVPMKKFKYYCTYSFPL